MNVKDLHDLLERYQLGTCSAEERKAIEDWYASLRLGAEHKLSDEELESSLGQIRSRLNDLPGLSTGESRESSGHAERPAAVRKLKPWRWTAAAACVLLAIGIWLATVHKEPGKALLADRVGEDTLVFTNRGETRQLVLGDGSTVTLNANTVFRYPKRFSGHERTRTRTVRLIRGEAFFQVITSPAQPFVVEAGNTKTVVLGTTFDIRAFEEEKDIRIALLSGRVNILENEKAGTPARPLLPHQFIRIEKNAGTATVNPFDNDYEVAAWTEGAMHFKDAGFENIAFEVRNKYNVVLVNKSRKQHWSYTGLFRNSSVQEVIETICQTENLAYSFTADGILIKDRQ